MRTLESYGIPNATERGDGDTKATCPCRDYGVGGVGEYYLIFDGESDATVDDIRPGIMGDANLDGTVDDGDASVLGANWLGTGKTCAGRRLQPRRRRGRRGRRHSGRQLGKDRFPGPGPAEAVPEPSTWCLLAGALAMLAVCRRKSR